MSDCLYGHAWVAGMMDVHDEDVHEVAAIRRVECERCEHIYDPEIDG